MHCFTGTKNALIDYLDLGVHIGLTGWICDDRRGKHLRDFIDIIPDDKLLIETDSPYLAPAPYRGKRNESSYIELVAKKIAEVYDVDLDYVSKVTDKNALDIFGI